MSEPKVVAIIQARMAASRLPGKVLKEIAGKPMLQHVIERARRARRVNEVMVATTTDPSDDAVESFCKEVGVSVFRGSMQDVLDRYYQAAKLIQADVIVRLTADCPLLDPALIDKVIDSFFHEKVDFAANRLPPPFHRTYPIGLDVEVCSFAALERAWDDAIQPYEREHVMPYLYDQKGRFKVLVMNYHADFGDQRWTVDTPQDLEVVRQVFARLSDKPDFTWLDVLALFQADSEIGQLNSGIHHKSFYEVDERTKKK